MSQELKKISRSEVVAKIKEIRNGRIYSVKFVKKDGTVRTLNTIKGTKKGVKGVGMSYDAEQKGLLPMYDIRLAAKKEPADKCWRMTNLKTIISLSTEKIVYEVYDDVNISI
jgi:hypothetical protein